MLKTRCGGPYQETEEAERRLLASLRAASKRKSGSRADDNKPKLSQSTPIKLHLPKVLFLLDTKKGVTSFFFLKSLMKL